MGQRIVIPTWSKVMLNKMSEWNSYDCRTIKRFLMIRSNIKIITWNAQGAGSRDFLNSLKDLVRMNDPTILVLVETRVRCKQKICKKIGFDGIIRLEAIGFIGGIWILWRKDVVEITEIDIHRQVVIVELTRKGEDKWVFSAIYANPSPPNREVLWEWVLGLKSLVNQPWLLMGDFNETLTMEERTGDSDAMRHHYDRFRGWADDMELIDLGFFEHKYTWSRGSKPQIHSAAQLDRGFSNLD
ncbi:LOW QUALITY PROTEIN: hypothetical protein V2J09_019445 [Rumex salicifolius]